MADVEVVTGDTDQFHWGTGTFASRGAVVAGNAVHEAAKAVRAQGAAAWPPSTSRSAPEEIELVGGARAGARRRRRARSRSASWRALANPMRGAVKPGTEPGLEATALLRPGARRHRVAAPTP